MCENNHYKSKREPFQLLRLKPRVRADVNLDVASVLIKFVESAKHRRLPTVMSDDDQDSVVPDDDQDSEAPSLATTGRHRHRHSQVSHDDDNEGYTADEGDNDDDDEEPIDNSLQKLGAKELKHTLHNEVSTI